MNRNAALLARVRLVELEVRSAGDAKDVSLQHVTSNVEGHALVAKALGDAA